MPSRLRSGGGWLAGHPRARLLAPNRAVLGGWVAMSHPQLICPAPRQPFRRAPRRAVPAPANRSLRRLLRSRFLGSERGTSSPGAFPREFIANPSGRRPGAPSKTGQVKTGAQEFQPPPPPRKEREKGMKAAGATTYVRGR